jgi:putative SOS response-associated peptidase YedK
MHRRIVREAYVAGDYPAGGVSVCGRFVLKSDLADIQRVLQVAQLVLDLKPNYNVAPRQDVAVVFRDDSSCRLAWFRWGLIPSWAKDASIGYHLINARAETVAEKPSFRSAFRKRRCLIAADGFYEWQKRGEQKAPMYFHLASQEPFGFAGLWETWTSPVGERVDSCVIITTAPNELVKPIHDRMPVILPVEEHALWLDPGVQDPELLLPLLQPYPAELMEGYEVSRLVNSPQNNSPDLLQPMTHA